MTGAPRRDAVKDETAFQWDSFPLCRTGTAIGRRALRQRGQPRQDVEISLRVPTRAQAEQTKGWEAEASLQASAEGSLKQVQVSANSPWTVPATGARIGLWVRVFLYTHFLYFSIRPQQSARRRQTKRRRRQSARRRRRRSKRSRFVPRSPRLPRRGRPAPRSRGDGARSV